MQQLAYFNENFSAADCNRGCDVCRLGVEFEEHDVTSQAQQMAETVRVSWKNEKTKCTWRTLSSHSTTSQSSAPWCGRVDVAVHAGYCPRKQDSQDPRTGP